MDDELPLPDIGPKMYLPTEVESMLHAYGKACADAATERERERCAKLCELEMTTLERRSELMEDVVWEAQEMGAHDAAEQICTAIRKGE